MKALGLMLAGLSLSLTAASASPRHEDVLSEMFAWWNQAFKSPGAFTENAFRRYFTEDAAIVLNGKESSKGIPALTAQFKRIQSEGGSVEIVLPFREGFQSGDKIFTYHFIRIERNGVHQCLRVMGYALMRHGRIALVNLLRIPEDLSVTPIERECQPRD